MGHDSAMGPVTLPPEIFVTWTLATSPAPTAAATAAHVLGVRLPAAELQRRREQPPGKHGVVVGVQPRERRVGGALAAQLRLRRGGDVARVLRDGAGAAGALA